MKILIFTDAWLPQVNGVVRTYQQIIPLLEKEGHQVKVIHPEMFKTVPCPTYPEIRLAYAGFKKVEEEIDEFDPDAVHIATEGTIGRFGQKYCKKRHYSFTTAYHTKFPEYVRERVPVPVGITYGIVRKFHSKGIATLVNTESHRRELLKRGFKNMVIWTRGYDRDSFKPSLRKDLGYEKPIFLYVGRLAPEKNIEAFLQLDLPGTKVVVGDGPEKAGLEKKYPDTKFVGYKFKKELGTYFASSDVFVFPSLTDTLGIVMIEALATGTPIAGYNVTGPKDVVKNGVNGYVGNDLKKAAMKSLKLDRKEVLKTAKDWSWENCAKTFIDTLRPIK